jgi:hypothetical protein
VLKETYHTSNVVLGFRNSLVAPIYAGLSTVKVRVPRRSQERLGTCFKVMHIGYRCNCGRVYESLDAAIECYSCYPEEVTICDECNEAYFDEDLAAECEERHEK